MPFAVTHVLTSIVCVDLYRDYVTRHKKYFTLYTIFIAGFAGLLPDIDIPLDLLLEPFGIELMHRAITHTPFFALIFLLPGIYFWMRKKHTLGMYFFVTAFAIMLHIFLDYLISPDNAGGVLLFYPFSGYAFEIGLLGSMTTMDAMELYAAIDAILLMLWLWHEVYRHKIKDYI